MVGDTQVGTTACNATAPVCFRKYGWNRMLGSHLFLRGVEAQVFLIVKSKRTDSSIGKKWHVEA